MAEIVMVNEQGNQVGIEAVKQYGVIVGVHVRYPNHFDPESPEAKGEDVFGREYLAWIVSKYHLDTTLVIAALGLSE